MKSTLLIIIFFITLLVSCEQAGEESSSKARIKTEFVTTEKSDFSQTEKIYLPVYSDIYFSATRDMLNLRHRINQQY